jgi:hypothetical protein
MIGCEERDLSNWQADPNSNKSDLRLSTHCKKQPEQRKREPPSYYLDKELLHPGRAMLRAVSSFTRATSKDRNGRKTEGGVSSIDIA